MDAVRGLGASLVGTGAELVTVEARFEPREAERTEVQITGLPDAVIRESRGRLLCALKATRLAITSGTLFLNLVPAARRKSGEILDLALALCSAAAAGHFDPRELEGVLLLGEVGIDGRLHAVPGGLAATLAAREIGVRRVIASTATAEEAACVPGVRAHAAARLEEVVRHLTDPEGRLPRARPRELPPVEPAGEEPLDRVRGQEEAKLALAIAAAGGHGLLLIGAPGIGKSMLARCLGSLLPPPDLPERLEITRVLSASGRWPGGLASVRPFRAPHHTVSYAGLVGGGSPPGPGEVTLAHGGVLFLDELPEFRREVLEALRQPLEAGSVCISRAGRQLELPARFQLIAAMNPCPCGYRGHPRVPCRCPPFHVERYRRRISGPLLDRIDLRVELACPALEELAPRGEPRPSGRSSGRELRRRVQAAQERMTARQGPLLNAGLGGEELDRAAALDGESRVLLERAARLRSLSARAVQSVRRVARTAADMEGRDRVDARHLAEALALRAPGL